MEKQKYSKESYWEIFIWLILVIIIGANLPKAIIYIWYFADTTLIVKMMTEYIQLSIVILFLVIFYNQKIYWLNGIEYSKAQSMSERERKMYVLQYLNIFLVALAILTVYNIGGILLESGMILDLCVAIFNFGVAVILIKYKKKGNK